MFCLCRPKSKEDDIDLVMNHNFNPLDTPKEKMIKLVILGPADSGKTTIIKQFKQITESVDNEHILHMASYIKDSIVVNMKILCQQSLIFEQQSLELISPFSVDESIQHLRDQMLSLQESDQLTPEIAGKIQQLWKDDGIQATFQQRFRFQIDQNTAYFMNNIKSIMQEDYVPDFEDYIRFRRMSIGFNTTKFVKCVENYGEYFFEVLDIGGAQSERKKWWKHNLLTDMDFDAVLYTVPISDYDLTLFEDNRTNRLKDAINLFKETMIKTDFLHDKPLFLLFNKYDAFVDKIKDTPITCSFDDFPEHKANPNDANDVLRFIAGKFLSVFAENDVALRSPLRILRSTAIDTENINNVFKHMMPQIIEHKKADFDDSYSS